MINAIFYENKGEFVGFKISGHSGYAEAGSDIVCSGVSSAVMLSINIISDEFNIKNTTKVDENSVYFKIVDLDNQACLVIKSLYKHLIEIQNDFKKFIKVIISEV